MIKELESPERTKHETVAVGLTTQEATDGSRHNGSTPDGEAERCDLPITGMTCAACARRIEKQLNRAPGVRGATVNFATSRATVEYDPKATGLKELIGTVQDAGYDTAGTVRRPVRGGRFRPPVRFGAAVGAVFVRATRRCFGGIQSCFQ